MYYKTLTFFCGGVSYVCSLDWEYAEVGLCAGVRARVRLSRQDGRPLGVPSLQHVETSIALTFIYCGAVIILPH